MEKENLVVGKRSLHNLLAVFSCLCLILVFSVSFAFAHKVNLFAYVENNMVHCEGYFPDGKVIRGGKIEVYSSNGHKLREGATDRKGLFSFKVSKADDLRIILNASMGHKSEFLLRASEFTVESGVPTADSGSASSPFPVTTKSSKEKKTKISHSEIIKENKNTSIDIGALRNVVDQSLDKKLKPIMQEIRKLAKPDDKSSVKNIVGGLGYIFGIMGLVMYFGSKKKT